MSGPPPVFSNGAVTGGDAAEAPKPGVQPPPSPEFEVLDVAYVPFAATPTIVFRLGVSLPSDHDIYTIALITQIQIDASRRGYVPETRGRLTELFGPPGKGAATTQSLLWARLETLVPSFKGRTEVELHLPCTYDLEVATAKYFAALEGGEVPLSFHFNGTVYYKTPESGLQITLIPWSTTTQFKMPVSVWRAMIDEHYPSVGWIRLHQRTLSRLQDLRAERGLTFDDCITELLDGHDAR
jgi:hypothetical protein